MIDFSKYGIVIPFGKTSGKVKTFCPRCRDKRSNKRDKSLSVNLDTGLFNCHYCSFSGSAMVKEEYKVKKEYLRPKWQNNTNLSDKLVKWFEDRGIRQETLKLMKITEGLEFMPQAEKRMNTVQFNYFLNGELINTKFRTGNKYFKLIPNAELILWNIDSIKDATECVITEGEIDALSYIQAGYKPVVSVPNGANANLEYLDEYIDEYFDNKETIYIASDTDEKGLMLRAELIRRLGAERCKIVTYSEGCKDANEHLVKCGTYSLLETIKNAKELKIEGIFCISDFENELDLLFEKGLEKGVVIGHENFDNLCSFETKRLCIVTGIPNDGKSEWVDEIIVRLNLSYKWKAAYFSPENIPLAIHAAKLISKISGKQFKKGCISFDEIRETKEYLNDNFYFISPKDDFSIETILDKARYAVKRRGIRALIIDPYNKIEHQIQNGMSETTYISQLLDKLHIFAQKNDCLIVLVCHPRKMNKTKNDQFEIPSLYDINGSANFFNKADFGITVYRNRIDNLVEVYVQKVKFKHLGNQGLAKFHYNINNGRYVPYNDTKISIDWDNKSFLCGGKQLEFPVDDFFTAPKDNSCPF